jgi:hypothetical protein
MSNEREPATVLREALAAEARTVTASRAFTDRVIGAAQAPSATTPTLRSVHSSGAFSIPGNSTGPADESPADQPAWRGWLLPVVAAAVVALLLFFVLLSGFDGA